MISIHIVFAALAGMSQPAPIAKVPFTLRGDHIFIDAKVNGHGPYPMNVDTGGGMCCMTGRMAKTLGIASTGVVEVGGSGAGTIKNGLAKRLSIEIGGVRLTGLTARIDDNFERMESGIGPELFNKFTVALDYDHMRMLLYSKGSAPRPKGSVSVPLRFQRDGSKPLIYLKIGSAGGWFMADTGAGVSLIVQRNFWLPNGLDRKIRPMIETIVGYGVGGPIYGRLARVPSIRFGEVHLQGMIASFSNMTQGTLASRERAGIVGQPILTRFNLIFDYANARLIMVPNRRFSNPVRVNRTGLSGQTEGLGYQIDYVILGSTADRAGLKRGDVIVEVEGKRVTESIVDNAFRKPVGTRIKLSVLRNDRQFTRTLVLRKIL